MKHKHITKQQMLLEKLQNNPVFVARKLLKLDYYWKKQREITHSVWNNRYTIVKSTTGTGKTFMASVLLVIFANFFRPSICTVIAPRWKIVNEQIFEEVRRIYQNNRVNPIISLTGETKETPHLKLGHKHFITGFSSQASKATSIKDLLTGLHSPHQFNVFDQSCGLTPDFFEALLGLMDSDHARSLIMSNPYNKKSEFAKIWFGKSKIINANVNRISINAFDNPNIKYKKNMIPGLSTLTKFREMILNWAKDDPLYLLHVLGEFIEDLFKILIPSILFENLKVNQDEPNWNDISIGLDIADEGKDKTKWVVRAGNRTICIRTYSGSGLNKISDLTIELISYLYSKYPIDIDPFEININIDSTGIGKGVYENLRDKDYNAHKIKTGRPVPKELGREEVDDFINFRAYLGFMLRKFAYNKSINIIPIETYKTDDIEMFEEECKIRYENTDTGKIKLMLKKEFSKEISRSPDIFDAYCLAFIPSIESVFEYFDFEKDRIIMDMQTDEEEYEQMFNNQNADSDLWRDCA